VRVVGWLDDPHPAYHGADVVVHPSLWEGLPRTLIEAQAAGRACVASDVKGNREVVSPDTGLLIAPRDAAGFARSLARLINEPERVQAFGQAARLRAEREFDAEVHAERVTALYDELLSVRTAQAPARRFALEPAA
jgi:glycosyltransferase involved in cell wall biosynthesis